jgi:hypothetical protein
MVRTYRSRSSIPRSVQWLPRCNGFNGVPMLCDFSVFDAEHVIERGGLAGEATFANDQDEVTHKDAA